MLNCAVSTLSSIAYDPRAPSRASVAAGATHLDRALSDKRKRTSGGSTLADIASKDSHASNCTTPLAKTCVGTTARVGPSTLQLSWTGVTPVLAVGYGYNAQGRLFQLRLNSATKTNWFNRQRFRSGPTMNFGKKKDGSRDPDLPGDWRTF